jgi:hypothetical protein
MDQALRIIRNTALRPEAWLDVYRLRAEAGQLSSRELVRLLEYPGLAKGFTESLPFGAHFDRKLARRANSRWKIDLDRDELTEDGHVSLRIPIEMRAAALISLTGQWGLPLAKLKCLLWPDQAHAFLQLDGRLDQLMHRLRSNRNIQAHVLKGVAFLKSASAIRAIGTGNTERPPSWLDCHREFRRSEIEAQYKLGSAQAFRFIQDWERKGWVRKQGNGPQRGYVTNVSTPSLS